MAWSELPLHAKDSSLPFDQKHLFSRTQCCFAVGLLSSYCILVLALYRVAWRERVDITDHGLPSYGELQSLIPNLNHLFSARIAVLQNSNGQPGGSLSSLGEDVRKVVAAGGSWHDLCAMDSDKDEQHNGLEMGDPCCIWTSGSVPYRSWAIKNPARQFENFTFAELQRVGPNCDAPEQERNALHSAQLELFYYADHSWYEHFHNREPPLTEPISRALWYTSVDEIWLPKVFFSVIVMSLILYWLVRLGLCKDLVGVGPVGSDGEERALSTWKRPLVLVVSYFYAELLSAVTHVALDFMPQYLPLLGVVAKQFQGHHVAPFAMVGVPFIVMIGQPMMVLGPLSMVLWVLKPCRAMRLFWVGAFGWGLLVIVTHRWSHIPEDELPLWWRTMQDFGMVMSNERHMHHHDGPDHQFGQLSGLSDLIMDPMVLLVPPSKFEFWTSLLFFMYVVPVLLGSELFWLLVSDASAASYSRL